MISKEKTKKELKRNILSVLTLGIYDIPKKVWKVNLEESSTAHKGFSFENNGLVSFVFRVLWFLLCTGIVMAWYFIKNLFLLILNLIVLPFLKD